MRPRHHNCKRCLMLSTEDTRSIYLFLFNKLPTSYCSKVSTRQMAQSLYVAPNTVRTQIKSIYRKLGVSSRGAAVEEAHAMGLI